MKNNFKILLLISSLLISPFIGTSIAQEHKFKFDRIGKEQGLIPGNVNDVVQDSVGFIWMATENGLCRYDGYDFVYYKNHVDDTNSLSYNHVFSLLLDKNGIIWIGTLGGGLNKFDSKTGKFKRFMNDPGNSKSIGNNNVFKVYKDSKKRIWVSTLGGGLNLFDPVKETFTRFTNSKDDSNSISSNMVSSLYEDKSHNFWIGTFDGGMNLFVEQNKKFIHFKNNPNDKYSISHNQVMEFLEDSNGRFWVATFGGGVNLFDRAKKRFRNIKNDSKFILKSDNLNIRKLCEDNESIWVGTYNGLFKFDKNTFRKTDLYSNPNDNKTINDNKIRAIYKDRSGIIWIGTIAGVNKYDTNTKVFTVNYFNENFKTSLDNFFTVPSNFMTEKILWAGPGKFNITKSKNRKIKFFDQVDFGKGFHTNLTTSFYVDENNILWVGSYNGIYCYDKAKNEFQNVQYFDDGTPSQGNNFVRWFYIDKKNRFWAGTMAGGLSFYDTEKNIYKRYFHDEDNIKTLGDSRVSCVLEDKHGIIWIGTYGGLDVLNEKEQTFKHYRVIPNNNSSLSNDRVYCIYESKSGELWIGTYQGLNRYNRKLENFERFTSAQGLSDNTVYSIQEDINGNLWLRTNDAISKFDPVKKTFKNYDENDGLPEIGLNGNISLVNKDGKIFFGFASGLVSFYPDKVKDNPYKPTVVFTKLTLMDKEIEVGEDSPITKQLNDLDEIILSHNDKVIGIEFSALHYAIPSKNQYAYKLEGVFDNWIFTNADNRIAKFTNLDPGDYVLKVKASNNDGIWSEVERTLKIKITPPFTATWWFRILLFITILFIIFLFYEIRLNKLLSIERTRAKIARNLHDEVGGTLSSIQYFVRAIEKKLNGANEDEPTKYLDLIMKSSADAQEKIKDLIWTVNPEEDGLEKFLIKLNRYASDLLDSKEIKYNIKLPGTNLNQSIPMEKRQHLWCICKEIITNIVKHSQCKNVNIRFRWNGKNMELFFQDDGIGFNESEKVLCNGIQNIKNRAEAVKANYKLTTGINSGTEWNFIIKI